jgi:hypothetical protein
MPVGLLINFNVEHLTAGVRRIINAKYKPGHVAAIPIVGSTDPAGGDDWSA